MVLRFSSEGASPSVRATMKVMALVISLFSSLSLAQEIQIVTNDFPPYSFKENNKVTGLATEVVQAILDDLNLTIKIKQYSWPRAYKMATTQKNVLIYPLARTPSRENIFNFIGELAPRISHFYKLKSRTDIKINTIEDLKQYKHGVVSNYAAHKRLIKLGIPYIQPVTNDIQNIKKLARGRIDLYAQDEVIFSHNIMLYNKVHKEKLHFSDFERAFDFPTEGKGRFLSFGPNADSPLINKFKKSFEKIKKSGKFDVIKAKYTN